MITLKQWMELVDYKITEGSDYFVNVEGLFMFNSWNGEQELCRTLNIEYVPWYKSSLFWGLVLCFSLPSVIMLMEMFK